MEASAPADQQVHLCENIGPAERAKRNRIGVVGSALTMLVAAAVLETHAAWPWRLLVGLPAMVAAMGFLQARAHTCVAFVAANIKVMGDSKSGQQVVDLAERDAFRRKARLIYAQGFAATAVIVAIVLALP
jgi:hypothetical protein